MTQFIDLQRRFLEVTDEKIDVPEALSAWVDHVPGSTSVWSDLLKHYRVVLLAEAGAGKTAELRHQAKRLTAEGNFAFFVALEDLDRESIDKILSPDEEKRFEKWKTIRDASAWFFLDSVDELKLTQGKLDRALRRLSKVLDGNLHRARIVVSCRPSDWRPLPDADIVTNRLPVPVVCTRASSEPSEEVFIEALRHEYGHATPATSEQQEDAQRHDLQTVVMLPLSNRQVERFARQSGVEEAAAFLAAVHRHDAWTFARRPLDLIALMDKWEQSGTLGTRVQQHETNVATKLRDDPDRPDNDVLSEEKACDGAERLALALALTRTRSIQSPEQVPDEDRSDGMLDSGQILMDWSEAERKALLRRALFDPATYGRVRFHSRSTQEYLAARHLLSLRGKGMSTNALLRLLFAERYGIKVVIPSMSAIAAWLALWDDTVCRELREREPEALLSQGDPESLDLDTRARIVRCFVAAYGTGGSRGLNVPIKEVRRLADPELAPVIRECWNRATNDEVRELLIEMIWQGAIESCADLARDVAFDLSSTRRHRVIAIRALIACKCDADVANLASDMLDRPTRWEDGVVHGVSADLFPLFLTAAQLLILMERTKEPRNTVGGFYWASLQIVEKIEPSSASAVALRDGLTALLLNGRSPESGLYDLHGRFDYLAPALATLCGRQLDEPGARPDAALVRASVIACRFGGSGGRPLIGTRESVATLRRRLTAEPSVRRDTFWCELAFVDDIDPTDDDQRRCYNVSHDGVVSDLSKDDRKWLLDDLADERRPERRPVALHALILLWKWNERRSSDLIDIRANLREDQALGQVLDEQIAPQQRDERIEELERRHEERKRAEDVRRSRDLEDWKNWRSELIRNPLDAFSGVRRDSTIVNIYRFLDALKGSRNRYDVWDRSALEEAFGRDVADQAEDAFRGVWRATRPDTWSARPAESRNSTPDTWLVGLAGVSAEAATPGWSGHLSTEDAVTATVYAMIELNGFAPFVTDLVESHPEEVAKVVGEEVKTEVVMSRDHEHLPVLQDLAYANVELKRICVPYLLDALKAWPSVDDDETRGARWRHLDQTLQILAKTEEQLVRETIAKECATRYREAPTAPSAVIWLKGLFRFEPAQGAKQLIEDFDRDNSFKDSATQKRAVEAFGVIFGEEAIEFQVPDPVQHASLLGNLVRLAFAFVRPTDDQIHDGAFSANARDNAERARGMLFGLLCNTPGPEARHALLDLAEKREFTSQRDYLRLVARKRAATDAEFSAFDSKAVVALTACHEAPPNDGNGLFKIMMDRLEDLVHDLAAGDFSDRRTVRGIDEETEVQRTLSWRLNEKARGVYRVMREEEVADAKKTDIRLVTVAGADERVVAEVKIADKWSLTELAKALREQLVGQYLRHKKCTCGCFLLTYHGRKNYWVHTDDGTRLAFSEVIDVLREKARSLEREHWDRIRIEVFGLDLTDP